MNPFVQQLEDRRLLSASLASGVLTIDGSAGNDNITVSLSSDGTTLTVSESKARRFGRSSTPTTTPFTAADVTSIVVNAGAGNDNVTLKGATRRSTLAIAAQINGGDGNDRLSGSTLGDTINGGAGDDAINGLAGADLLNGGDGDDNLDGGADNDTVNGDAGDDKVTGGAGVDNLNGGADDDLIVARDGATTDVIDGGSDSAAADEDDADKALVDDGELAPNATVVEQRRGRHGRGHGFGGFSFGRRIR